MKFKQRTHHSRSLISLLALGLFACLMSSCSTDTRKIDPATHTVPAISNSWVKVRSKPPTWYPRGVAADHPTDYRSGSWVEAEDSLGSRFFIPTHGLPSDRRKILMTEALAARNPRRVLVTSNEDINFNINKVILNTLAAPFILLFSIGQR